MHLRFYGSRVIGIVWGILPLNGMFGVISYFVFLYMLWYSGVVAIFGITLLYCNRYLGVNTEDFDVMTILQEGAMPAICLFFVLWIFVYSSLHF